MINSKNPVLYSLYQIIPILFTYFLITYNSNCKIMPKELSKSVKQIYTIPRNKHLNANLSSDLGFSDQISELSEDPVNSFFLCSRQPLR